MKDRVVREYDFDDVLLQPRYSKLHTADVDTSAKLSEFLKLEIPVIAAPMAGIVGVEIIKKLSDLGGIGILHRFHINDVEYSSDLTRLKDTNFGTSVPLTFSELYLGAALDCGAKIICVDVANGYSDDVFSTCVRVATTITRGGYKCLVMSGNVVDQRGCLDLQDSGVSLVRVGIGSGALCTTRNATGVGRPQISAIADCSSTKAILGSLYGEPLYSEGPDYKTTADGGIRNSGDAAKALAAGADTVMMGSFFAKAFESENDGKISGMASKEHQMRVYGYVRSVEGITKHVEKIDTLENLMNEFVYGLKHAMTYTDSKDLVQLRSSHFVEVSDAAIKKFGA